MIFFLLISFVYPQFNTYLRYNKSLDYLTKSVQIDFSKLVITDVDGTIINENELETSRSLATISRLGKQITTGIATGRSIDNLDVLQSFEPKILITSVGTEIYFKTDKLYKFQPYTQYIKSINKSYNHKKIKDIMKKYNVQQQQQTREFKISFDGSLSERELETIKKELPNCNIVYSEGQYLDILAKGTGKGEAIKFLMDYFNIQEKNILTVDDSNNGRSMLLFKNSLVPFTHDPEIEDLDIEISKYDLGEGIEDWLFRNRWVSVLENLKLYKSDEIKTGLQHILKYGCF